MACRKQRSHSAASTTAPTPPDSSERRFPIKHRRGQQLGVPEPPQGEDCCGKLPGARWQTLTCTELQRLQPFDSVVLQMCQLPARGCSRQVSPSLGGSIPSQPQQEEISLSAHSAPASPAWSRREADLQSVHLGAFCSDTAAKAHLSQAHQLLQVPFAPQGEL